MVMAVGKKCGIKSPPRTTIAEVLGFPHAPRDFLVRDKKTHRFQRNKTVAGAPACPVRCCGAVLRAILRLRGEETLHGVAYLIAGGPPLIPPRFEMGVISCTTAASSLGVGRVRVSKNPRNST